MRNKTGVIALLFFAGCATSPSSQLTTADSLQLTNQMQEKVDTIAMQLHADCDSTLLQEAQYKADSIRKKKGVHPSLRSRPAKK